MSIGCGVVNPNLLGAWSRRRGHRDRGNVVIMVVNETSVTGQANVTVTKENGGQLVLNVPVPANEHVAVVQNCDVDTIQWIRPVTQGRPGRSSFQPRLSDPDGPDPSVRRRSRDFPYRRPSGSLPECADILI